jgi:hypothetical protein
MGSAVWGTLGLLLGSCFASSVLFLLTKQLVSVTTWLGTVCLVWLFAAVLGAVGHSLIYLSKRRKRMGPASQFWQWHEE